VLWLVSVAFGLVSGVDSVITGLHGNSLGGFAVGLGVLADVTGSAALIWRFGAERRRPGLTSSLSRSLCPRANLRIGRYSHESAAALAA